MSNETENDDTYFNRDYQGYYMETLTLGSYDMHGVPLYKCNVCAALTTKPAMHEKWHRDSRNTENAG